MKILFFGNALVERDSLVLRIVGKLKEKFPEIDFEEADGSELPNEEVLNILDVAEGIEDVVILDDVDRLKTGRIFSMHDFDLAQNLKLMKKFGIVKKANIIAVPSGMGEKEAVEKTSKAIASLS